MSAEIFGPAAPIVPFDDENVASRIANDTGWGLVGYIFTQDIGVEYLVIPRR